MSETLLCYFVTSLAEEGMAPSTIRVYLAAVRHAQILEGFPEPREASSLPRLHLVQSGIRRARAEASTLSRQRLPITPALLHRMRPVPLTEGGALAYDDVLLWSAATMCFFGFFRAGELTVPNSASFNPATNLAWGDVAISADRRSLRVFLRRSKTDQYGRGVEVFIGSTGDSLCPVEAAMSYAARCGPSPGAFFCSTTGVPLSKARFVALVRASLSRAGVSTAGYSGHSFHIGAATTAAEAGVPDSAIQALGRWSSTAFLTYIRTPRERLAQLTPALARR